MMALYLNLRNGEVMKREEDPKAVLVEDIDEEVLSKLPLWFRRLRKAYQKSKD